MTARAPYADHNNGSVTLTVTNFGALGYWDYRHGYDVGSSFRYSPRSFPALYHGSLMVAAPPDRVSDCAYGDSMRSRFDFITTGSGILLGEGLSGGVEGHVDFTDDRAEQPLDVSITQNSYSFADAPDDDYVILSYAIANRGARIDSLYVGLFLDWDIVQSDANRCRWDETNRVGWVEYLQPGWPVFGAGVLDMPTDFHVAVESHLTARGSRGWSDLTKMNKILGGFAEANGGETADWAHLVGSGPLSLGSQESITVTFAVLAGDDTDDLFANIAAARDRWRAFEDQVRFDPVPSGFRLIAAYPNPFNSSVNILCRVDVQGSVHWSLYDPAGRLVLPGGGFDAGAGRFTLPINALGLPSGRYMVRFQYNDRGLTVPVTLIR